MSKPDDIDDVTGASMAEMEAAAEDLYQHRDQAEGDRRLRPASRCRRTFATPRWRRRRRSTSRQRGGNCERRPRHSTNYGGSWIRLRDGGSGAA